MLCKQCVAHSDMQRAFLSGKKRLNSLGASVSGTIWKTVLTPSIVRSSPVLQTMSSGGIIEVVPVDEVSPSPDETNPSGPGGKEVPYM